MIERPPLPARIRVKLTPAQAAEEAKNEYLNHRLQKPSIETLQDYQRSLEPATTPYGYNLRAAVIYDLATSDGHTREQKAVLFDQCGQVLDKGLELFNDREFKKVVDVVSWINLGLWSAYLPHLRFAEIGASRWDGREESRALLRGLMWCGVQTIREKTNFMKGKEMTLFQDMQAKFAVQSLFARYNSQAENRIYPMRPVSFREGYHAMTKEGPRVAWDVALTIPPNEGKDVDEEKLVRILHLDDKQVYDPSITLIHTKEDLGLVAPAEVIKHLTFESIVGDNEQRGAATHQLDMLTKHLFNKVGLPL